MPLVYPVTVAKFYLHDAASPNAGSLPSGSPDHGPSNAFTSAGDSVGAATNRDATGVVGAANPDTDSTITSLGTTAPESWGHRRFLSRPLAAQTIPAGTWRFSYARTESSTNHNQTIHALPYVWRPSAGAVVGLITSIIGSSGIPGTSPAGTTELAEAVTAAGNVITILDGDILVFEIWTQFTQSMATAYTDAFSYDGTTEASVTTCASFIAPPSALPLLDSASNIESWGRRPVPMIQGPDVDRIMRMQLP